MRSNDRKQKYRGRIEREMMPDDKTTGLINKFTGWVEGGLVFPENGSHNAQSPEQSPPDE